MLKQQIKSLFQISSDIFLKSIFIPVHIVSSLTPGAYLASGSPRAEGLITRPELPVVIRDSLLEAIMVEFITDSVGVDSMIGVSMVDMEGMEVGMRGREFGW